MAQYKSEPLSLKEDRAGSDCNQPVGMTSLTLLDHGLIEWTPSYRISVRYEAATPDDGVLRERLKALAAERRGSATDGCTSCSGVRAMR